MRPKRFSIIIIILFVLFCGSKNIYAESNIEGVGEYKKALEFFNSGDIEATQALIKKNYMSDSGGFKLFWMVLESSIYLEEEKYESALRLVNEIKPTLQNAYYRFKEEVRPPSDKDPGFYDAQELTEFNYEKLLNISVVSNFKLGNYLEALNGLLEERSNGFSGGDYGLRAVCFYQTGNYLEALINFQYIYKTNQLEKIKYQAAFNVGVIYSILDDVDNAIMWFTIPLSFDRKVWLPQIIEEKHVDNIRNSKKFKKFLEQWY